MSDPTLFAAPNAAAHVGTAGGTLEVTFALLLVLGVIALLAWLAKRMRRIGGVGVHDRIQVLGDRAVGQKERLVLVRVGDTEILVGVASGNVQPLHVFPVGANTAPPPAPETTGPDAAQLPRPADAQPW